MSQKKPNIVFIFSDQQRWDTLGCYGQKYDISPNLDKLAAKGTRFVNAVTCQPVCGPARSCLQTGKYATQTGTYRNGIALNENEKTIAHYMKESGYQTGYVGKWHLASNEGESNENIGKLFDCRTKPVPENLRGGYEYWRAADVLEFTSHRDDGYVFDENMKKVDFSGARIDKITDFALDFISQRNRTKPFFLVLSHIEPHHQNDENRYHGPDGSKEKFKDFELPSDLADTNGDWRENFPDYLGNCERLDQNVGRIIDLLDNEGITDNTLIIYTSDHGSHFKTRNAEYKRSCHEGSIRIPMIAHGMEFCSGKDVEEIVSLIDIVPTLLKAAGYDKPKYMPGNHLQRLVVGDTNNWPEEAFIQISESQVGRAIRTAKWTYSVNAFHKNGLKDMSSDIYYEEYLYDLENDYSQKNNLVSDPRYTQTKLELTEKLKNKMRQAGEKIPIVLSKKV